MARTKIKCITCGRKIRPKTLRPSCRICGEFPQQIGTDGASLIENVPHRRLNRFVYGPNDIDIDLSCFTIAQAVEALADVMNYDPLTVAVYVDGKRVGRAYVIQSGQRIELMRERGSKGGRRRKWNVGKQTVLNADCLNVMEKMASESIDVTVTSLPYNVGIKYGTYNDKLEPAKYSAWCQEVFEQLYRVIANDGSFYLNVGANSKNPYLPFQIMELVQKAGFVLQNDFVWAKCISTDDFGSFGHFRPINSSRFVHRFHESVWHLTKTGKVELDRLAVGVPYVDPKNSTRWKHGRKLRCRGNVWLIPYDTIHTATEHPAAFPPQLVMNCLRLHGLRKNPKFFDPCVGIGSGLVASETLGVRGIGVDIDSEYCRTAVERIKAVRKKGGE